MGSCVCSVIGLPSWTLLLHDVHTNPDLTCFSPSPLCVVVLYLRLSVEVYLCAHILHLKCLLDLGILLRVLVISRCEVEITLGFNRRLEVDREGFLMVLSDPSLGGYTLRSLVIKAEVPSCLSSLFSSH